MLKRAVQDNAEIVHAWAEALSEAGRELPVAERAKKAVGADTHFFTLHFSLLLPKIGPTNLVKSEKVKSATFK